MQIKKHKLTKIIAFAVCFLLCLEQSGFAQIAAQLDISGQIAALRQNITQDKFRPLHLRYLSYDRKNNNFKLLLDKGDLKNVNNSDTEKASKKLLEYFLIGISLPNEAFWVNLRPDSPQNVIDPFLSKTDIGRVLLEADLELKKDTALATSPETAEGKEYWDKLYKKAGELFGSDNVTIPTLTRPWIVPDEIIIRETADNAYIYKATLKVMLEQDYLKGSATYNFKDEHSKQLNDYASQLVKELIIPKLNKEINTSKKYAALRQVYYSLILAQWFKQRFYGKGGLYSSMINRQNLTGLTAKEPYSVNTYFEAYQKSFQNGEYNFKQPVSIPSGQTVRSYFSGGFAMGSEVIPLAPGGSINLPGGGISTSVEGNSKLTAETLGGQTLLGVTASGGSVDSPLGVDIKVAPSSPAPSVSSPAESLQRFSDFFGQENISSLLYFLTGNRNGIIENYGIPERIEGGAERLIYKHRVKINGSEIVFYTKQEGNREGHRIVALGAEILHP